MFQLGLVDTRGGGIKKIYENQIKRFFPLPDYELNSDKTKVTIIGKILNLDFANLLTKHPDLSLSDIFLLDKVQKRRDLSSNELKYLKNKKYVEGRKPNIFLSHSIVEKTKDKELIKEYEENKGLSKNELKNMILSFIKSKDKVYRTEIDQFIWDNLPNILTHNQKLNKIRNIIQELRREEKIFTPEYSCWIAK
jgi:ATP-dependent DNA helicase RecG